MTDFRSDLAHGRYDVPFFAERFFGINLHPGQRRFAKAYAARNKSRPWMAAFLWLFVSAGNRAGKTLVLAIIIFHSCFYKMGLEPPATEAEAKRWLTLPYTWYHLAISQEISYLVFYELQQILAGTHPAQGIRGCPLTDEAPNIAFIDEKWASTWNYIRIGDEWGGARIHFRTTADKATGTLGRDMNGISVDEAGFEQHLDYVVKEVLHMRRAGTGGPIIMITTPTADIVDFSDFWNSGDPENPDRMPRAYSLRISTRENVGYGLDEETFKSIIANMTDDEIAQNIDGKFVQSKGTYFNARTVDAMFVDSYEIKSKDGKVRTVELTEMRPAEDGHSYVQGVDPALTYDAMWSIVLDITDGDHWEGVKCGFLAGRRTQEDLTELTIDHYNSYEVNRRGLRSHCSLGVDATGMGGKMFREQLDNAGVLDVRNIEFGGRTLTKGKRKVLTDLRSAIDNGRIRLPRVGDWMKVRRQFMRYRTDITKPEDDAIMALGCAIQEALRYSGRSGGATVPFDARLPDPSTVATVKESSFPWWDSV